MSNKPVSRPTSRERWQSGATAIEYGLIAAFVALAVYAGTIVAGNGLGGIFFAMDNQLQGALRNEQGS
ncbi:Flp family type IVb pilin [Dongia sp.]|uniref:Flp family type IVb pilin n=1 Tax=Dongia sp. TaxID=1977262 RepID=UPI0035B0A67E